MDDRRSRGPRRLVRFTQLAATLALATSVGLVASGPVAAASDEPTDREVDHALIDAAWRDDVAAACELIAAGADVNAKDATVQSAYLVTTSEGYLELLDLTLAHGADVTSLDSYRGTGLIRSAERGHWPVVGRLLRAGIDPDHINRLGWAALHEAIILGDGSQRYIDTIRLLVAGGADVELATGRGELPLDLAIGRGQDAVVTTLSRALEERPSGDPDAALGAAVTAGDGDGAAIALRAGAQADRPDSGGDTAMTVAERLGHDDIVRLLDALAEADPSVPSSCPA